MSKTGHIKAGDHAVVEFVDRDDGSKATVSGTVVGVEGWLYIGPFGLRYGKNEDAKQVERVIEPQPPLDHQRGDVWRKDGFCNVFAGVEVDSCSPEDYAGNPVSDSELSAYWTRIYREDES